MILPLLAAIQFGHPHSSAELVSTVQAAQPGKPFLAAIHMRMDPTWHTYWINPGDSGTPTTIDWTLPAGWKAGQIEWPTPHRLEMGGLVNYGYENDALLLVRITPSISAKPGSKAQIKGVAKWLICQQGCLPAQQTVSLDIGLGAQPILSKSWYSKLESAQAKVPQPTGAYKYNASGMGKEIQLKVSGSNLPDGKSIYFFPADETVEPAAKQTVKTEANALVVTLKVSDFAPARVTRLKGLLSAGKGHMWSTGTEAIVVDTPVETNGR